MTADITAEHVFVGFQNLSKDSLIFQRGVNVRYNFGHRKYEHSTEILFLSSQTEQLDLLSYLM